MKTPHFILAVALGLAGAGAVHAFDPVKGVPTTEVVFFEPEKFTDVKDSPYSDSERDRKGILDELSKYLVKQTNRVLAPGQKLKITVTDIDLAGEFEPWRTGAAADIRIVKDIYPPDIKLSFQLTAADGTILKQGDRNLRDLSFMMTLTIDRSDPLRYEKDLLDSWVRQEFRETKKK